MTQPTDTMTALARRYALDVNVGTTAAPDWQRLIGVESFKPIAATRKDEDEAYEDDGAARQTITGSSWRIELKLIHRTGLDGVTFNPVQKALRTAAQAADTVTGEVHVRWYDRNGAADDAYGGRALVDWSPDGGNGGARDTVEVVLHGQGARVAITNPAGSPAPVVSALSPATGAAAGGTLVTVIGGNLTGATAVAFGASPAPAFTVVDSSRIVAESPAGAAGTVEVTVTTPEGTSATTGTGSDYVYA